MRNPTPEEAERILKTGTPDELLDLVAEGGDAEPASQEVAGISSFRKRAAKRLIAHPEVRSDHLADALMWPTYVEPGLMQALKQRIAEGDPRPSVDQLKHCIDMWEATAPDDYPLPDARAMLEDLQTTWN